MNRIERYFDERIRRGEMGHAYLIEMEEGPERLQTGRRIAARLLCEEGSGCGHCRACRTALEGNHPDVIVVTHEKPKVISVDEIRQQLVGDMAILPYRSAYKIYLVDEAEKMNPNAQNALLKTLEEPPAYGVILLMTENRNMLLPTILSRIVAVNGESAEQETPEIPGRERLFQLLHRIAVLPVNEMAGAAAVLKEESLSADEAIGTLKRFWRDVAAQKAGAEVSRMFPEEETYAKELAEQLPDRAITAFWETLREAEKRLSANVSPDTVLEICLLRLRESLREARQAEEA